MVTFSPIAGTFSSSLEKDWFMRYFLLSYRKKLHIFATKRNAGMKTLVIKGEGLTIDDVCGVAQRNVSVRLCDDSAFLETLKKSRDFLMQYIAKGYPTYGVTTNFGDNCDSQISPEKANELQHVIVTYHGIGLGQKLSQEEGRAVVLCRLNGNVKGGHSAIRVELAQFLETLLQKDIIPVIPELGSVGASGDLTPLSYLGAVMYGEREVYYKGKIVPTMEALNAEGIQPLPLEAKEGLAIMNGTSVMTAIASLAWKKAARLANISDFMTAVTNEIMHGTDVPFRRKVSEIKNHPGQIESANRIYEVVSTSRRVDTLDKFLRNLGAMEHKGYEKRDKKLQSRYSIRCAPQINGVLRDTLSITKQWIEQEINSANDNPLVDIKTQELFNTGNFYGGHICASCDYLRIALANISDLADKQAELIIDGKFNGLTDNLIPFVKDDDPRAGLRLGFKGAQITISAIRGEVQSYANPISITSSPTEALNQDKVSMGTISARKLRDQINLIYLQMGVHLLAACQAMDLIGADKFSPITQKVYAEVRKMSAFVQDDRQLDKEATAVSEWLKTTELFS